MRQIRIPTSLTPFPHTIATEIQKYFGVETEKGNNPIRAVQRDKRVEALVVDVYDSSFNRAVELRDKMILEGTPC